MHLFFQCGSTYNDLSQSVLETYLACCWDIKKQQQCSDFIHPKLVLIFFAEQVFFSAIEVLTLLVPMSKKKERE